MKNRVIH